MRNAIISIEDQRFYTNTRRRHPRHRRARSVQDVVQQRAAQGGSTITQQFVKNALQAQNNRTVFQKLREAALAYHLTRKWSKAEDPHRVPELDLLRQRRLRDRVRRADVLRPATTRGCGTPRPTAARQRAAPRRGGAARRRRRLARAATTRSPTRRRPSARRNLVLQQDARAGLHHAGRSTTTRARQALPAATASSRRPSRTEPRRTSRPGCASSSSTASAPRRAFEGGLKITTTLDLDLQQAAENAVKRYFCEPDRPDRGARGDRQQHRRGPRDGRRARLQHARRSTSPRRASASRARRSSRSCSPTALQQRHLARLGVALAASASSTCRTAASEKFVVNNYEGSYSGIEHARGRD